jgi:outer membrane immunogenic protein
MHRRIMLMVALAAVSAQPVLGADLGARPLAVTAPAALWSGFYAGVNVGGAWTSGPSMSGVIGGGQVGYNWQFGNWVFGPEADIQGTDLHSSRVLTNVFGQSVTSNRSVDYLGTVRGRIGLVSGDWLPYLTGGLAYTTINSNGAGVVGIAGNYSASNTNVGFTVGGGVEWAFRERWSAKAEYLYSEFSGNTNTYATTTPVITIRYNTLQVNMARVGVNYHFAP